MAFKINIDKYAYSASPEKNTGNYAAELAKNLIADEAELRAAADEKLKDEIELAVAEEAALRLEAHNVLDERITLEVTRRTEGDNLTAAKLTVETEAREAADNSLLAKINEEATTRAAQDLLLRDEMTTKADKADTYTKAESDAITNRLNDWIGAKANNIVTVREAEFEGTFEKTDTVPNILDNLSYLVSKNELYMSNDVLPELYDKANKSDVYTKSEIDNRIGDVETALDNIIALQNTLIGGDSV